jgi:hypothetical protein
MPSGGTKPRFSLLFKNIFFKKDISGSVRNLKQSKKFLNLKKNTEKTFSFETKQ